MKQRKATVPELPLAAAAGTGDAVVRPGALVAKMLPFRRLDRGAEAAVSSGAWA
jgi:hypothetical protein